MKLKYLPGAKPGPFNCRTLAEVANAAKLRYERDRKENKTDKNPFAQGSVQFKEWQSRFMGHTQ